MAAIQKTNIEHINNGEKVVVSMDLKALHPSLDISFTTEIVCEEFFKSEIKIENIDYEEMGLYIRINRNDKYMRQQIRGNMPNEETQERKTQNNKEWDNCRQRKEMQNLEKNEKRTE